MDKPAILESRIHPPASKFRKLLFYIKRDGLAHACMGGVGRKSPYFWKMVGSRVTHGYLKRAISENKNLILNLGGGSNINSRYVTADIDPRADVYADITKPLNIPENSIANVFLEEVIEHVSLKDGLVLLKECWRILRPEGRIRISTPDFAYYARGAIDEGQVDELNEVFYNHGHCYIYTKDKLRELVLLAGFADPKFDDYQGANSRMGFLDSHAHRFNHSPDISMYLEAEKKIVG